MMRAIRYAILGFAIATAAAWGALLLGGAVFLTPGDSYWDRTPYAADIFLATWLALGLAAAIFGAKLSQRQTR